MPTYGASHFAKMHAGDRFVDLGARTDFVCLIVFVYSYFSTGYVGHLLVFTVQRIANHCPYIQDLDLSFNSAITDASIVTAAR